MPRKKSKENLNQSPLPRGVKLLRSLRGHTGAIGRIAWSPDGKILATPSFDRTICLWDAHSGERLSTIELDCPVFAVAFHPDGTLVGGSNDGVVRLWNAASGELRHTLNGHKKEVWSVACDAEGRTIASASRDQTAKLWDAASGRLLYTLKAHSGGFNNVAFDTTGRILASGGDDLGSVCLWDVIDGRLLHTLPTAVSRCHLRGVRSPGRNFCLRRWERNG